MLCWCWNNRDRELFVVIPSRLPSHKIHLTSECRARVLLDPIPLFILNKTTTFQCPQGKDLAGFLSLRPGVSKHVHKLSVHTETFKRWTCPPIHPIPSACRLPFIMKIRIFRLCSLFATIPLFFPNQARASASFLADDIESSTQAPNTDAQTRQDLWGPNSLSSLHSVAPETVLVADVEDSDARYASCANNEVGTKNRKLRIRNGESCPADGGVVNRLKLPGWATPWRTKKQEAVKEPNESNSCMGVVLPNGMKLPFHLCCLGIVPVYVNGMIDRISQCVFEFAKCEKGAPFTWQNQDVCCQTFSVELGSEFATGINCLPRI